MFSRGGFLAGIVAAAGAAMVPAGAAEIRSAYARPRFAMPTFSANGLRVILRDARGPMLTTLRARRVTWVALLDGKWFQTDDLAGLPCSTWWRDRLEAYGYFTTNAHGVVGFTALYRA